MILLMRIKPRPLPPPARLTPPQVSGIEGNFRTQCQNVMRVLRANKESVTAMLEAFVHDPLINWRLLNTTEAATEAARDHDTGGTWPLPATLIIILLIHHILIIYCVEIIIQYTIMCYYYYSNKIK